VKKQIEYLVKNDNLAKFGKFLISGGTGFLTYILFLYIFFTKLQFHYLTSVLFSYIIATIANFTISKLFVFCSKSRKIINEYSKFLLIGTSGLLYQIIFIKLFFDLFVLDYYLSNILACGSFMIVSFFLNLRITFRNNTSDV
jgi:dolichol-phosphate mannosyltransferase